MLWYIRSISRKGRDLLIFGVFRYNSHLEIPFPLLGTLMGYRTYVSFTDETDFSMESQVNQCLIGSFLAQKPA